MADGRFGRVADKEGIPGGYGLADLGCFGGIPAT